MKFFVTVQQIAFFSQNGYIELEGLPFVAADIFAQARSQLAHRCPSSSSTASPSQIYAAGRDLWRGEEKLRTLLVRKLASTALSLIAKPIRLACDQWIPSNYPWQKAAPFKDLFSIQGLALGALFCSEEVALPHRSPLGLLPLPKNPHTVLFVKPDLLLDWPGLLQSPAVDLYFASYAFDSAVYIQNPHDPSMHDLKQLGYHFGDVLQNSSHPLIR